jgi:hypothetical protein
MFLMARLSAGPRVSSLPFQNVLLPFDWIFQILGSIPERVSIHHDDPDDAASEI